MAMMLKDQPLWLVINNPYTTLCVPRYMEKGKTLTDKNKWSDRETAWLIRLRKKRVSIKDAAAIMDRTVGSVKGKITKLRESRDLL